MNSQAKTFIPAMSPAGQRAWFAFGLWLRLFIAGLALLAAGVVPLFGGTTAATPVFVFLIGGGALAVLAWRRAGVALARIDRPEPGFERFASQDNLFAPYALTGASADAAVGLTEAALEYRPR